MARGVAGQTERHTVMGIGIPNKENGGASFLPKPLYRRDRSLPRVNLHLIWLIHEKSTVLFYETFIFCPVWINFMRGPFANRIKPPRYRNE